MNKMMFSGMLGVLKNARKGSLFFRRRYAGQAKRSGAKDIRKGKKRQLKNRYNKTSAKLMRSAAVCLFMTKSPNPMHCSHYLTGVAHG